MEVRGNLVCLLQASRLVATLCLVLDAPINSVAFQVINLSAQELS